MSSEIRSLVEASFAEMTDGPPIEPTSYEEDAAGRRRLLVKAIGECGEAGTNYEEYLLAAVRFMSAEGVDMALIACPGDTFGDVIDGRQIILRIEDESSCVFRLAGNGELTHARLRCFVNGPWQFSNPHVGADPVSSNLLAVKESLEKCAAKYRPILRICEPDSCLG